MLIDDRDRLEDRVEQRDRVVADRENHVHAAVSCIIDHAARELQRTVGSIAEDCIVSTAVLDHIAATAGADTDRIIACTRAECYIRSGVDDRIVIRAGREQCV